MCQCVNWIQKINIIIIIIIVIAFIIIMYMYLLIMTKNKFSFQLPPTPPNLFFMCLETTKIFITQIKIIVIAVCNV